LTARLRSTRRQRVHKEIRVQKIPQNKTEAGLKASFATEGQCFRRAKLLAAQLAAGPCTRPAVRQPVSEAASLDRHSVENKIDSARDVCSTPYKIILLERWSSQPPQVERTSCRRQLGTSRRRPPNGGRRHMHRVKRSALIGSGSQARIFDMRLRHSKKMRFDARCAQRNALKKSVC